MAAAFAIVAVGATFAVNHAVPRLTFLFAIAAVVAAARYGGFGAGVLAAAISAIGIDLLLLQPTGGLIPTDSRDLIWLLVYFVVACSISAFANSMRSASRHAEERARECASLSEQLRGQMEQLESEMNERRAAQTALAEAKRAAEEANEAKSQFLANTSHEIRTPLNAVLGYADLLEVGIGGPLTDQQREYLSRIGASARHLLTLIDGILDLAKIESGNVTVVTSRARVSEAVDRAVSLVHPQLLGRNLRLTNACGARADAIYHGDPERVTQILVNLLGNAVRFTEPGGRLTVTCGMTAHPAPDTLLAEGPPPTDEGAGDWVFVRVEDTGIGIPSDRLDAIWEPFEQADRGHTRNYGGTGLGLTISRRLARLMAGDLTVRSREGLGSAFFLWLPAAPNAADDIAVAPLDRRGEERYVTGLARMGEGLVQEIEYVLRTFVRKVRDDPGIPSARGLSNVQLEDHTATFIADLAHALVGIEHAEGGPSEQLRDGSAIQRLVAERHGAQRYRIGFSEDEIRREYELLREEISEAARRGAEGVEPRQIELGISLLDRLLNHAQHASVAAYRRAAAEDHDHATA